MDVYGEGGYWIIKNLFFRGLALTYLIAFLAALRQYTSLVGEKGILPIKDIAAGEELWTRYSLFYYLDDDRFIDLCAVTGILIALLTLGGITLKSSLLSGIAFFTMWLLFLSFVNTGQIFYSFGWETILLETGFLAIFMGGLNVATPEIFIWLLRWILFRMMIGSALIKIRGDEKWRDLAALEHHFETQPFPNPLSRFLHNLPDKLLKAGTLLTHTTLLLIPLFYFLPQPLAAIAGTATITYQLMIFAGGNYAWLNLITAVLALSTFNDSIMSELPLLISSSVQSYPATSLEIALPLLIALLSYSPVKNMLSFDQVQNRSFSPFHLVNSYGAFAEVPEKRLEIIIEGYVEGDWIEYSFYEKPGELKQRPRQISPYVHRLDYPFWFLAHGYREDDRWLEKLLEELKSGNKQVLKLFDESPEKTPEKVRARIYRYRFADKGSGKWWERTPSETLKEL